MKIMEKLVEEVIPTTLYQLKQNAPHITFGAGIVGFAATVGLASRATLKARDRVDVHRINMHNIETKHPERRVAIDQRREIVSVSVDMAKIYAIPVAVGGVTLALFAHSHMELTRRNTALVTAYSALQTAVNQYRERVREQVGEEKEQDLWRGVRREVEGTGKDKNEVAYLDPENTSPYVRCWDESNVNWTDDPEYNMMFLRAAQQHMNDLLWARGFVLLNDAYDALGFERSGLGSVVGWTLDEGGDNFVDFGIFEARNSRFVNTTEPALWLDFNVDGMIANRIDDIQAARKGMIEEGPNHER